MYVYIYPVDSLWVEKLEFGVSQLSLIVWRVLVASQTRFSYLHCWFVALSWKTQTELLSGQDLL